MNNLEQQIEDLKAELESLRNEYREYKDSVYEMMLEWRNIIGEVPCKECGGSGVKLYCSTSTWRRGGFAGQAITFDICDVCWGSGVSKRPWTNLRKIGNNK